jgi:Amt family ammonium transporter
MTTPSIASASTPSAAPSGPILTGVFAVEKIGQTAGLIEGNAGQVLNQVAGVAIVFVYDAVVSLIILKLLDWTIGLRVQ